MYIFILLVFLVLGYKMLGVHFVAHVKQRRKKNLGSDTVINLILVACVRSSYKWSFFNAVIEENTTPCVISFI